MNELASAIHSPVSLYIHLPWCLHKCAYCDFNSHATQSNAFPEQAYVAVLIKDLSAASQLISHRHVQSIFIGGGTPSLFTPDSIEKILTACKTYTALDADCEITLETNPGTFEYEKFSDFLNIGVNRLSIGVQSLNQQHLTSLQRIHTAEEAILALEKANKIGFNNVNADLMFGLPNQSIQQAQQDIQGLCQLPLSHVSYYQLTLEPNTIFYRFPPSLPSDDAIYTMHNNGIETLSQNGYQRYEVSAYARMDNYCLHNTNYWQFGDYLGIGAGAHSKLSTSEGIIRHQRSRQPESYIQSVNEDTHVIKQQLIAAEDVIFEFMLNNLRLMHGFTVSRFVQLTGLNWSTVANKIESLVEEGLLELNQSHYRATPLGYRFLDELTQRFLAN